ncbi:MAG: UvrD-helicase domain-containing protein, partial [Nitrospira sp.]|nr:UvrD-helicase domain-containing protein [Nitrospira sp.]
MSREQVIPDAQVRRRAATTFDRNVVMVAGAGTGKTTLLVNRLVHLLMREPRPVAITRLVALTFTNKAATEMRIRLRERLARLESGEDGEGEDPGAVTVEELHERYGLTSGEIAQRAKAALGDLEKAQIGTLHSFAAHLLRLYPLESGVDPDFRTDDDGGRFEEHFAARWAVWLDRELRPDNPQAARWRRVLTGHSLEQVRELAYALRSELIPLDELRRQVDDAAPAPALREWLAAKRDRAELLLRGHEPPKKPRKVETMLAAARAVFAILAECGPDGLAELDASHREELQGDLGNKPPKGWSEEEFSEAKQVIALAQQALSLNRPFMQDLLALLCPFVQDVRASFLREGWVSFDGLLAYARDLLRAHPGIRERLKQEYQAVLVDEFQDTDPVQYE